MKTQLYNLFAALLTLVLAAPAYSENAASNVTQSEPTEASLGIAISSLPETLASHLPDVIVDGRGVLVSDVLEGSAAEKAGIQRHDILVRYNNQDLYSSEQLIKQVRNDKPGSTVELEYVRAGKLQSTSVTLDKTPKRNRIHTNDWSGMTPPFNFPWSSMRPNFLTETQDATHDGTEWSEFVSLSVVKEADGTYTARITFNDPNKETVSHEFKGTRQEVREAINADESLPDNRKQQLLRTLDDRASGFNGEFRFNAPAWNDWRRGRFQWPNAPF